MSWTKTDQYMSTVKSIVSELTKKEDLMITGKNLVLNGQVFWEDGSKRPSRPSHSHRLLRFTPTGCKPLVMLRGYQTGSFDVLIAEKSKSIIQICTARELRVLKPEPDASQLKYGCIFKNLGLEGATYAGEVIAKSISLGLLASEV